MCSHTWFRDLLYSADIEFDHVKHETYGTSDVHKVAHEAGKRGDQVERIGKLGGLVAPILNQGDIAGLRRACPNWSPRSLNLTLVQARPGRRLTFTPWQKWAGEGWLSARYQRRGWFAMPAIWDLCGLWRAGDERRITDRRGEIERQTNGVAYAEPLRDYRWYRFESSRRRVYDQEEDIWQAVAQYVAGYNPWIHRHPDNDFPEATVKQMLERLNAINDQPFVDHVCKGFWAADLKNYR